MKVQKMRKKKIIICLQIVITLILLFFCFRQINVRYEYEPELSYFLSDYAVCTDDLWRYDPETAGHRASRDDFLNEGPYVHLNPGSYTLEIEYETDAIQTCVISAESRSGFVRANPFYLSANKQKETYHFYTTNEVADLTVRIRYSGNGFFELKNVRICRNLINFRLLLFVWVVLLIFIDGWWLTSVLRSSRRTFIVLVSVSVLSCLPALMDGLIMGFDYAFHLNRIEGIAQGIRHLQIPVRMNYVFNDGYGYPLSIFYGDAFLYIAAVFRILGFTVLTSYKLLILIISFLTMLSAYLCLRQVTDRRESALMASAAYVAGDYRLLDVFQRFALGESIAFIFYPMIVLAVWKLYTEDTRRKNYGNNSILLAMGMLGILHSHLLSLEMVVTVVFLICIFRIRKTLRLRTLAELVKAAAYFVLGGLSFLIPFLDYFLHCEIVQKQTMMKTAMIQKQGVYLNDLFSFYKKVDGAATITIHDRARFTPGFLLMLALVMAMYLIYRKKGDLKLRIFALVSGCMLFFSTNIFPWDGLASLGRIGNYFAQIQFPFRYLALASCTLMFLLFVVLNLFMDHGIVEKKHLELFFIIALLLSNANFLGEFTRYRAQDRWMDTPEIPFYTCGDGARTPGMNADEYLLKGTQIPLLDHALDTRSAHAQIIDEELDQIRIRIVAQESDHVDIPRFNYPHYSATDSAGRKYSIETGNNNKIRIILPGPVDEIISVRFEEPLSWKMGTWISLAFFAVMGLKMFLSCRKAKGNCRAN